MSDGPTNVPEPKTTTDQVVFSATHLLDQDIWERWGEHTITIRGVEIWIANGPKSVGLWFKGTNPALSKVNASEAIGSYFWDSYMNFVCRRREEKIADAARKMNPPMAQQPAYEPHLSELIASFFGFGRKPAPTQSTER